MESIKRVVGTLQSFKKGLLYNCRNEKGGCIPFTSSNRLYFDKNANITLNGRLTLTTNQRGINDYLSILEIRKGASLLVEGNFSFAYGADVRVFEDAVLILKDNSYINNHCLIRCKEKIVIGENCAIAHNCTIFDSDFHWINEKKQEHKYTQPVIIGNHVWIGANVTILKGVHIGDNAVIAAGTVVNRCVPEGTLVAGNPAKIVRKNVQWGSLDD